jgi:hypothetical protein
MSLFLLIIIEYMEGNPRHQVRDSLSNKCLLFINDGDFSRSDGKQNIPREVVPVLAQMKESF